MMRQNVLWSAVLGIGLSSALVGCGGKEQADGCKKDLDCKGDRVCVAGHCQDSGGAGVGQGQPGVLQPGAMPPQQPVLVPQPQPQPQQPVPVPQPAAPAFRVVPEAEWAPALGPRMRIGAIVSHAVFEGPIGPSATSWFVVTWENGQFHATLWADGRGYRNSPLANNGGDAQKVPAVSFFDADGDGTTDVLVMATYLNREGGPPPAFDNVLLRWNGTALVRMPHLEANISGLESVAAVRAALRR